jgi:integrase
VRHDNHQEDHGHYFHFFPYPKNREPRPPLNYGTILLNYREAQRKGNIPCTGTHILRHGMASLARKVGGGLDAVIAMTGHKDLKLADHYSKLGNDHQKETSIKIMKYIRSNGTGDSTSKRRRAMS